MSRTMFDACDGAHVPDGAPMIAYYIYGNCAWPPAQIRRFPNAVHVRIATVASLDDGHVLDVEAGDAAPDLAPGWVARRRAAGADPSVYCNISTWPTVRAAFAAHAVAEPHWWIAHYDDVPVIPAGAVAKQYLNDTPPGCDTSIVADYWPGVDPIPEPLTQGDSMYLFVAPIPVGVWCLDVANARYFHIASPPDETTFATVAKMQPLAITAEQHAILLATYPPLAVATAGTIG